MSAQSPGDGGKSDTASADREITYRRDAASYVAAMLAELRQIAGKAGLDRLVMSLDAAYYEAYGAVDSTPEQRDKAAGPQRGKTSISVEPFRT